MKLITRTISEKVYKCTVLNMETRAAEERDFSLGSKEYSTKEKTLKALREAHDTDTIKIVEIDSVVTTEALYAMTELCFINNAIKVKDVAEARAYLRNASGAEAAAEAEAL